MFMADILSKDAFLLHLQSWAVETETIWPAEPRYLLSVPCQEKFANPCSEAWKKDEDIKLITF